MVARVVAVDDSLPGHAPKVNEGEYTEMEQTPPWRSGKLNKLFKKLDL